MTRLQEIQDLIDSADVAYYTKGSSIMEDARYDKLKSELEKLNPTDSRLLTVGSTIKNSILQKTKHTIPMGSLGKATNQVEWNDWIKNNLVKVGVSVNEKLHASLKLDGGSFSSEWRDGRLVSFVSRGDGLVGEDVTSNAVCFKGLPTVLSIKGKKFNGFVRGEVLLKNDDWDKVDPNKESNPRNLAVGIARRKDGTQSEFLTFYAFRMFDADGHPFGESEVEMTKTLANLGFETSYSFVGLHSEVWDWYLEMAKKRSSLPFWIDGIVVKVNDIEKQLSLGESSNCPKGQVAIKFEAEGETTVLRGVTLQVGHTGAIAPVANFDPVRIGGTTITNATLCNWENIATLGVAIGDEISVIKAGDIIPRIMEVVKEGKNRQPILKPTKCPDCGGSVGHKTNVGGDDSAAIFCHNDICPSVVMGKIERYVKSLDIQGLGTSVIEGIIKNMKVTDAADLYTLERKRANMANIYLNGNVRLGEKRVDNILKEIEKKKTLTISEFLGSLGISGLGKRRVQLIQDAMVGEMDTLEDWTCGKLVKHAARAGVKNLAKVIQSEIDSNLSFIEKFITNGVVITKPIPKSVLKDGAVIICITGALSKPKSFYQNLIEQSGNGYADSFSKSVTHLVAADIDSGSNKLEKAKKAGVKIIDEAGLMKLVGDVVVNPATTVNPQTNSKKVTNNDNPWFD